MIANAGLPVFEVLPDLLGALQGGANAVLIAPPGAGKTTAVAPALLDQRWCSGQIWLLSPRRLAARSAAERIAFLLGEKPGHKAGWQTRMDSCVSQASRIIVMTEGIFLSRILADPELSGVSAVLFDEVHERSLDCDFGLALALESQSVFRPDLRLLAMSATLDGERFARLMGQGGEEKDKPAPLIESAGRSWPLELRHVGRRAEKPLEQDIAAIIRQALREEEQGDMLVFLPGLAEIRRTQRQLEGLPGHIQLHCLYGAMSPQDQRAVLQPARAGQRKIILATNIAETSLTIDGVRIVIDSGLSRRAQFDPGARVSSLITTRASQASMTQRSGRAARQGPGVAYRMWEEAAFTGFAASDPPEITSADLAPLMLRCAAWGETSPQNLRWIDPPPFAALDQARTQLQEIEAIGADGAITAHGELLVRLPMAPHIAHMLVRGSELGAGQQAAELAMLLQERGLGGQGEDLEHRLSRWRNETGQRARAARKMAQGWAAQVAREIGDTSSGAKAGGADGKALRPSPGLLLSFAFPDRIARRRDDSGEQWHSTGGRGFTLDAASPLAREAWLVAADVQGKASRARIVAAAAIGADELEAHYGEHIAEQHIVRFDRKTGRVEAMCEKRLGAVLIVRQPDSAPDADRLVQVMLEAVREYGLELLPWDDKALSLRLRAQFAGIEALGDQALLETLELWLAPLLSGLRSFDALKAGALSQALSGLLSWDDQQKLERLAPAQYLSPAGTRHDIDYAAEAGPMVELRVQALFGLSEHPCIGPERLPLILSLTSPAGRPVQTTADLPGFWAGSWADVARDMRARYPRHHWPDDPANATPSLKTKRAQGL